MNYTVDDLIYWLRNGNNGDPFLDPEDILVSDPELEVNYFIKDEDHIVGDVTVYDPKNNWYLTTNLDDSNEIIWEDWEVISQNCHNYMS